MDLNPSEEVIIENIPIGTIGSNKTRKTVKISFMPKFIFFNIKSLL